MPPLLPHLFLRPVTALVGALLLNACSQASPTKAAAPTPALLPVCTRADSLNGISGHTFGEPLRNFTGLSLHTEEDRKGVAIYWMGGAERGWFGQHDKDVVTYYQFRHGKFARFRAETIGIGANRTSLREQACCLFGPGHARSDLPGGLDWEGKRVRVRYYEEGTSPVLCYLEVSSKPLLAMQQVKQRAIASE